MHILITGNRNVGKTTVVDKIQKIIGIEPTGFKTRPFFDDHDRLAGFIMTQPTKSQNIGFSKEHIIGYTDGVNWEACPDTFEDYGVNLLEDAIRRKDSFILMDELGFFESDAKRFQSIVMSCLDQTEIKVLAVVKNTQTDFLDAVRNHPNAELYHVNLDNRDSLPEKLSLKMEMDKA